MWPNGWMDQDATCYRGWPRPRSHCVRWGPNSPKKQGHCPPIFGPCLLRPNGWMDEDATYGTEVGLGPGHVVLDGDPFPPKGHSLPIFGPCLSSVQQALSSSGDGRPFSHNRQCCADEGSVVGHARAVQWTGILFRKVVRGTPVAEWRYIIRCLDEARMNLAAIAKGWKKHWTTVLFFYSRILSWNIYLRNNS